MTALLIAYLALNLDDMFINFICNKYPTINFIMICSPEYNEAFVSIPNLKLYNSKDELCADNCMIDIQILIGGSLFMQPKDRSDIYSKFLYNKQYRLFDHIPMIILGANFGPFDSDYHYQLHKEWFKTIDYISFRDKYSFELFRDIDCVTWAPDILLNYPMPVRKSSRKIAISCIHNDGRIGLPNYNEGDYIKWMVNISNKYIDKGFSIYLFSFCNKQGDAEIAYKIDQQLTSSDIIEYTGNINYILTRFSEVDFVIGTRFHSIIFALSYGVPVFPIVYNSKTRNMLDCYGFDGRYANIQTFGEYH